MGKSNRSINPADALRKKQRKRELKKNKDERKRARDTVLAKKDVGKVRTEISRLESMGQLAKPDQARLDSLKAEASKIEKAQKNSSNQLSGAHAAYAARMQENEKKHEGEARKMVYDPKSGKFVATKRKDVKTEKKVIADQEDEDVEDSDSDSDSSSISSVSSDGSIEGIETEEIEEDDEEESPENQKEKEITESDDEYEIPLPPGPPPSRPFASQVPFAQSYGGRVPPPPPPPLPYHSMPQYRYPPPQPYGHLSYPAHPSVHYEAQHTRPPVHYEAQPTRPPVRNEAKPVRPVVQQDTSSSTEPKKPVVATISAEPQLRDLQKELLGFVPAAVRRRQVKRGDT